MRVVRLVCTECHYRQFDILGYKGPFFCPECGERLEIRDWMEPEREAVLG